jgi:hypothetical protein
VTSVSSARGVLGGALLGLVACENDVAVHLLRPAPPAPSSTSTTDPKPMPTPTASTPLPEPCVDGDPCSGLARALRFRGAYDRIEVPSSTALDLPQDFAFEAWVLLKSNDGGHGVLNRWQTGVGDIQLTFGTPEPLPQLELPTSEPVPSHILATWAFVRPEYWLTVVSSVQPSLEKWHHLATSYGAGQYRLYVDGVLAASMAGTEPVANPAGALFIGATARYERGFDTTLGMAYWPPIDGFIADVRLSAFDRYPADFTPESELQTDEETLALWRLDEGEGTEAHDAGPSQIEGAISGATWEMAPRRGLAMPQ